MNDIQQDKELREIRLALKPLGVAEAIRILSLIQDRDKELESRARLEGKLSVIAYCEPWWKTDLPGEHGHPIETTFEDWRKDIERELEELSS